MSETPRDEGEPELSDPTAPIDTTHTQSVPAPAAATPPPGPPPGAPGPGDPTAGASAYQAPAAREQGNPFASPPEGGAQPFPYAAPPPPPGYGSQPWGNQPYQTPGYGQPGQGAQGAHAYGAPGYGGAPAYGGAPGYGAAPGYGGAPGYAGPYAPSHALSGGTIALLVVSGLATIFGGWGIPALILGIIAAARKDEPSTSANLTRWGWIALGVCFLLAVLAVIVLIGLATTFGTNNSFGSGA